MADIGVQHIPATLPLTYRRDFKSEIIHTDESGIVTPWPPGDLYIELWTEPARTELHYTLTGNKATLNLPQSVIDTFTFDQVGYQLVFKAAGETGGGECLAMGCAYTQTPCCD